MADGGSMASVGELPGEVGGGPRPEEAAGIQCLLPTPDMGGAPLRAHRGVNSVSSHVEL